MTLDVNGSGSFTSTTAYPGVYGYSTNGGGVSGGSANNIGVFGTSDNSWGVYGLSYSGNSAGVYGLNTQIGGYGVIGQSSYGIGVRGESSFGTAIYANGSAGGTTNWNGASDIRYKTNVRTLYNALDTILALRGVNFDWKRSDFPDKNFPEGRQVGFIAQEIEKFLPEVVSTDGNGYKSVAYASVVPILVEAVKTLKKHNDATKQENARKDARISELEAKLNALAEAVHQLQNDRK